MRLGRVRAIALLLLLLPYPAFAQASQGEDGWLVEGDVACPRIALVFNTGIGRTPSQTILQTLIEKDVPATMFPIERFAWSRGAPLQQVDEEIYDAVFHSAFPGAIVEMHLDSAETEHATALALPRLVDDLQARGFAFVTIGELREPCEATGAFVAETITLSGLDVHGGHCKSAPSPGAVLIRILLNGDKVITRGPAFDGWLPVECAGRDGWVKASTLP